MNDQTITTLQPDDLFSSDPVAWTGQVAGKAVTLRKATQADLDFVMGKGGMDSADVLGLYSRLAVVGLANPDGSPMFKRADAQRIANETPLDLLRPLAQAIQDHCGFGEDVDDVEGN